MSDAFDLTSASPCDLRAAQSTLTKTILNATKARNKAATQPAKPPPTKKRKVEATKVQKPKTTSTSEDDDSEEAYHFIGYVPAHGKVWELDGLKSGPLEVGELIDGASWMDIARPALRMKMQRYGGNADDAGNIRFSLLALVDDEYIRASDRLQMLQREKVSLERRLANDPTWEDNVC